MTAIENAEWKITANLYAFLRYIYIRIKTQPGPRQEYR